MCEELCRENLFQKIFCILSVSVLSTKDYFKTTTKSFLFSFKILSCALCLCDVRNINSTKAACTHNNVNCCMVRRMRSMSSMREPTNMRPACLLFFPACSQLILMLIKLNVFYRCSLCIYMCLCTLKHTHT